MDDRYQRYHAVPVTIAKSYSIHNPASCCPIRIEKCNTFSALDDDSIKWDYILCDFNLNEYCFHDCMYVAFFSPEILLLANTDTKVTANKK